ncbi:hypothetical protein BT69DRAFT_1336884 [Atractiella rhizophila]|nr:hypothetical protein BT69DRAFT_1336884 [Atractiella rhizophila]
MYFTSRYHKGVKCSSCFSDYSKLQYFCSPLWRHQLLSATKQYLGSDIGKGDDDDTPSDFENPADNAVELRLASFSAVLVEKQRASFVILVLALSSPNYNKEPYLHQFLFQCDPVEEENARDRLSLRADDPLYVVKFGLASYYISKAFTDFHIYPVGRSTKCFYAYFPRLKKLVLLKDIWRKMEYEKEGDTIRKLNVANVPAILDDYDIEGDLQKIEGPYRQTMQRYVQVTDKIGRRLSSCTSSWEMVSAVCEAVRGHEAAWERTSILHRDISSGNIHHQHLTTS